MSTHVHQEMSSLGTPPLNFFAGLAAIGGLCMLTACSSPTGGAAAPTFVPPTAAAAQAAPTAAREPTPVPTSLPVPTAAARPTQTPDAQPSSVTPTTSGPGLQAAARPAAGANAVRLVLDPAASQASYHAHEQLAGKSLPSEAVGTSQGVSGSLLLGTDGSIPADQSTITVDLTQLKSDESRRDNYIKSNTLETNSYPTAIFVAHSVQGVSTPLPTSGTATFQLLGDLTVHGVTRPVTWQVAAQFADTTVTGSATTSVNISDFGMTPPKAGPVLSIEDALGLELTFTANTAN